MVYTLISINVAYHLTFWFIGYGLRIFSTINNSNPKLNDFRDSAVKVFSILAILSGFGFILIFILVYFKSREFIGLSVLGMSIGLILGGLVLYNHLHKEKLTSHNNV